MAYPNKTLVPTAISSRTKLDLTGHHVTSSDFLQFQVSKIIEVVPGQSIDITHKCFSRLAPMPVPTFGNASIVHRAFFVPMRTIFPSWNDFITDTPHYFSTSNSTQIVSQVITMPNNMMLQAFLTSEFATVSNESSYDFGIQQDVLPVAAPEAQPTITYYKFTDLGRFSYKLLRSLGITLNFQATDDDPISLLPIFAAIRVYYDYFYPSQYINDEDSSYMVALLTRDVDPSTFVMDVTGLQRIFQILSNIPYPTDYFTGAWDNPAGPTNEHFSDITMPDITMSTVTGSNSTGYNDPTNVTTEDNGTPVIENGTQKSDTITRISQYALNSLRALSDYMRRHQIAGSRALDRYLSRFGVTLESEKLNRCIMLNEYAQDIQFGDVMSMASTSEGQLGDYAGKGLSYGENVVNFSAQNEYGYLIIVTSIIPKVQYYQGYHRMCKHISRTDFFTPEFDNLGTQAIGFKELYCYNKDDQSFLSGATIKDAVFGFTPRYAEYKIPYSQITGDLSLNSFKTSSQPWTLFRDVSPLLTDNAFIDAPTEIGINFIMATDRDQYGRIFYPDSKLADHFNVIHKFDISSSFPGKSLYDDYVYENEDKAPKVSVQVNGSTAQ